MDSPVLVTATEKKKVAEDPMNAMKKLRANRIKGPSNDLADDFASLHVSETPRSVTSSVMLKSPMIGMDLKARTEQAFQFFLRNHPKWELVFGDGKARLSHVLGLGNCAPASIAVLTGRSEHEWPDVRQEVQAYALAHYGGGTDFEDEIAEMGDEGAYQGEFFVRCAAERYRTTFVILCESAQGGAMTYHGGNVTEYMFFSDNHFTPIMA